MAYNDREGVLRSDQKTITIPNGKTKPTGSPDYLDFVQSWGMFNVTILNCAGIPAGATLGFNVDAGEAGLAPLSEVGDFSKWLRTPPNSGGISANIPSLYGMRRLQPELSANATQDVVFIVVGFDPIIEG